MADESARCRARLDEHRCHLPHAHDGVHQAMRPAAFVLWSEPDASEPLLDGQA